MGEFEINWGFRMRNGFEQILGNAKQDIQFVEDCLEELRTEKKTRKLWKAWFGLIDHYSKAVSAMRRATDQGKSKAWSDKLLSEQKRDHILQYALKARDHSNHVFEDKREVRPSIYEAGNLFRISGPVNAQIASYNNVVIGPDGVQQPDLQGAFRLKEGVYAGGSIGESQLKKYDHALVLNDVTTRGKTYKLPNPNTPKAKQAIEIGEYVLEWLKTKATEAEELAKSEKS